MAEDKFSGDESRKLAVLIARVWADPQLAKSYQQDPNSVLQGAGIDLAGRAVPQIPEKPVELAAHSIVAAASGSSASSISTAGCPATGCTASCACCNEVKADMAPHIDAIMKLAEDPAGRKHVREMMAKWDVKISIHS